MIALHIARLSRLLLGIALVSAAPSFAQSASAPETCSIHFWPAADMPAKVDAMFGGGYGVLSDSDRPLAEVAAMLRTTLDAQSQFDILKTLDFSALTHGAATQFYLEAPLGNALSLKKKSPPLRTPETKCYFEIIIAAAGINAHPIYGVALNMAVTVRTYDGSPVPRDVFMTGAGKKIENGKQKVRESSEALAGDMKRIFREDLESVLAYAASRLARR